MMRFNGGWKAGMSRADTLRENDMNHNYYNDPTAQRGREEYIQEGE